MDLIKLFNGIDTGCSQSSIADFEKDGRLWTAKFRTTDTCATLIASTPIDIRAEDTEKASNILCKLNESQDLGIYSIKQDPMQIELRVKFIKERNVNPDKYMADLFSIVGAGLDSTIALIEKEVEKHE